MDLQIEFEKINSNQKRILELLKEFDNSTEMIPEVYTLSELAKLFKVTIRTIYNWKERGILSCTIIGSKTYVTKIQFQEFLSFHEVKSINHGRQ